MAGSAGSGLFGLDLLGRLGLLEVELSERRHRPQRPGEVWVDQLAGGVVERGGGAAVRAGCEPEVRDIV